MPTRHRSPQRLAVGPGPSRLATLPPRCGRPWRRVALLLAAVALAVHSGLAAPSIKVATQVPGASPFINSLVLTVDNPAGLDYVTFTVQSKPGSVVRPVSARYSADYLRRRGYLDAASGLVTVPVFGLYAKYTNTVDLQAVFLNGYTQNSQAQIATPALRNDAHKRPQVVLPRTADTTLSYDYMLVKSYANAYGPMVIDTDGEIRWVNTSGVPDVTQYVGFPAIFYQNGVYTPFGTGVQRVELDGTATQIGNYADQNVATLHHNIDVGRDGLLIEVDTPDLIECTALEINPTTGAILHTWNFADIVSAAMTAGGDDPTQFVKPAPADWFHNNSITYRASDNTLIVSGREDFVMAIDYDSGALRWILGDPSKYWYTFPSLRAYALNLGPSTQPPVGEHSLSIVRDRLLLFDNGFGSQRQPIPGKSRTYSAARKYKIDLTTHTATEIWRYTNDKTLYSPVCSSIYEDQPNNYLLNYSDIEPGELSSLVGLNAAGQKVFDYRYAENVKCIQGWNATPIHLENLVFN